MVRLPSFRTWTVFAAAVHWPLVSRSTSHIMSQAYEQSAAPRRTFYRRPLPSTCTALSSREGRECFESALAHKGLKSFFPLMEQFSTQSEPAFCGISTLVIVLNALAVDPRKVWKGSWRWYEESMLNCCIDLEEVKNVGITLHTFECLARCQGLQVQSHFASESSLDTFREAVRRACVETATDHSSEASIRYPDPFLVVSYCRSVLHQTGSGHFSPVAAYDAESDNILILDTARFKYGAHWVPLPLIFEAMQPQDSATGKSRGYVLLSFHEEENPPSLPLSILFRTKHSQGPVRQLYKLFLQNNKDDIVTWDQVVSYWTRAGTDFAFVWQMTEPQLSPLDSDGQETATAILKLIHELVPPEPIFPKRNSCHPNMTRALCLNAQDAIFVIFLASIGVEHRKQIIFSGKASASDSTRHQLMAEADLFELAIELSDQIDAQ